MINRCICGSYPKVRGFWTFFPQTPELVIAPLLLTEFCLRLISSVQILLYLLVSIISLCILEKSADSLAVHSLKNSKGY